MIFSGRYRERPSRHARLSMVGPFVPFVECSFSQIEKNPRADHTKLAKSPDNPQTPASECAKGSRRDRRYQPHSLRHSCPRRCCHDRSATAAAVSPVLRLDRCCVWFVIVVYALTSSAFHSAATCERTSCAINPGQQCRCSLIKRVSGRVAAIANHGRNPQILLRRCSNSADSFSTAVGLLREEVKCSVADREAQAVELSITQCHCGSESPAGVSLVEQPRLPVASAVIPCRTEPSRSSRSR